MTAPAPNNRPNLRAEGRAKTNPDVNSHHDRGYDDRHGAAETQILPICGPTDSILRTSNLSAPNCSVSALRNLLAKRADLHGVRLVQTD